MSLLVNVVKTVIRFITILLFLFLVGIVVIGIGIMLIEPFLISFTNGLATIGGVALVFVVMFIIGAILDWAWR